MKYVRHCFYNKDLDELAHSQGLRPTIPSFHIRLANSQTHGDHTAVQPTPSSSQHCRLANSCLQLCSCNGEYQDTYGFSDSRHMNIRTVGDECFQLGGDF